VDLVKISYHDVTEYEEVEYTKDLHELQPDTVELIGWLLKKGAQVTLLAIGKSDDTYEHVYVIPNGCIVKIEKLEYTE
jgi:hypothetical protein